MPTEPFSTEISRSWADVRSLLAFRAHGLTDRQRRRLRIAAGVVLGITVSAIVVPAYLKGPLDNARVGSLVGVLPSFYLAFFVLTVVAAVANGGGREIVPREQAVAFPVSTWTDHFGALLLAPLNIAWLLQGWTILGATSYVLGPAHLWASALPIVLWIVVATTAGQLFGWLIEGVRRMPYGRWVMRGLSLLLALGAGTLLGFHKVTYLLDNSQAVRIYLLAAYGTSGQWGLWAYGLLQLTALVVMAVVLGGYAAGWTLRKAQREESRLDSGTHRPRGNPTSDLVAMMRIDRGSVWRSVPLRRGILVLALLPGLVAASGSLRWDLVTILPGLVASGGGLLFGVNAWSLDGRGGLWRESLPASQGLAFASKALVLFELLMVAAAITTVLAGLRAGPPTAVELLATIGAAITVSAAVVSAGMRWSIARPFAVDLRSARATPAPPVVMVGYSARLALTTTFIGLIFSGLAFAPDWRYPILATLVLGSLSGFRIWRSARRWQDPATRSRVIATVAS